MLLQFLKHLRITQVEERSDDAWFDLSIRQLRKGKVRFYSVKDFPFRVFCLFAEKTNGVLQTFNL